MQGKEQKQPHERGAEQNKHRWNEERNGPLQQEDRQGVEQELPVNEPLDEKAGRGSKKQVPEDERSEKTQGNESHQEVTDWERNQEKAILNQLGFHSPITHTPDKTEQNEVQGPKKEADREDPDDQDTPKQKPAGVLIWKKESDVVEEDSRLEVPVSPSEERGKVPAPETEEIDVPSSIPDPSDSSIPIDAMEKDTEAESSKRRIPTAWKILLFLFLGIPLLSVIALVGGLLIGYSVVGDDPAGDVFSRDLWKHLYNLIYG